MKTKRKLNAGKPGTKRLLKEYGENLVCVRYKYDKFTWRKQRTIELILDEDDWIPTKDEIVFIRIDYGEKDLGIQVKNNGGVWNKNKQLWEVAISKVIELNLKDRIVNH